MKNPAAAEESRLQKLLKQNAAGYITIDEYTEAERLIAAPTLSEEDCWVCKMACPNDIKKSIFDTGLCQGHANYALKTQK
jgi:hypothetical protein